MLHFLSIFHLEKDEDEKEDPSREKELNGNTKQNTFLEDEKKNERINQHRVSFSCVSFDAGFPKHSHTFCTYDVSVHVK